MCQNQHLLQGQVEPFPGNYSQEQRLTSIFCPLSNLFPFKFKLFQANTTALVKSFPSAEPGLLLCQRLIRRSSCLLPSRSRMSLLCPHKPIPRLLSPVEARRSLCQQRLRRQRVPWGRWHAPAQAHHLWWDPAAGTNRTWSRGLTASGYWGPTPLAARWALAGGMSPQPSEPPNLAPRAPLPAAAHGSPLVAGPTLGAFTRSTFIPQLHLCHAQEILLRGSACTRLWYLWADAQEGARRHRYTALLPPGAVGLGILTKIQEN